MANIIKPKRSTVALKVPTTSDLVSGELGVNMTDKKVYINNGSIVVQIAAGELAGLGDVSLSSVTNGQSLAYNSSTGKWENSNAGAGDVVGAASSTDNALVRFDGTTGKVIQNSTATLDDSGNLDVTSAKADYYDLDTAASAPAYAQGRTFWDAGNGTSSTYLNADVTLQNGQEIVTLVYNGTGSTITNGSVVAVAGAQGQRPSVVLADADTESTSASTLGIATQDIPNGTEGFVTSFGFIRGIDTSAFTAGDPIYLSQTAGQFTATRPLAPAHTVFLGWVIKVNASSGEVFVHISNGWELSELHDVRITSPVGGNLLAYDQTNSYWKNIYLTDGTGISVTETTGGAITITNTAPDQTVSISGTSPVSVSGTYPSFTVSMTQASGSVNGWLSSTDWTTFNNKGNGTVTSVSGTGGYGGLTLSGTVTSSGNITLGGTPTGTWPISVSGNAAGLSATLAIASGGTGATTGFKLFACEFTSNINANTNRTAGAYGSYAASATNTPTNSGILYNFTSQTDGSGDGGQFWQDYVTNNLYLRQRWGGTYGSWLTMVSASNISSYAVTSVPAKMIYDTFLATAGQTTFTTSQTYTSGKIEVFVNGVKMRNGDDVTVTSGTSVVFASGLTLNDEVDLVYPI